MVIIGEWWRCDDGITRPTVLVAVTGADGGGHVERFLIDTGSDRTVFSALLLGKLGWQQNHAAPAYALQGIGGLSAFVEGTAVLEMRRADGGPATISGSFCAFTDPAASDLSILGRDVLANFDVITSRRRNEVLLLAGNHQYQITTS